MVAKWSLSLSESTMKEIEWNCCILVDGIISRVINSRDKVAFVNRSTYPRFKYHEKSILDGLVIYGITVDFPFSRGQYLVFLFNSDGGIVQRELNIIIYKVVHLPGYPNQAKTAYETVKRLCKEGNFVMTNEHEGFKVLTDFQVVSDMVEADVRVERIGYFVDKHTHIELIEKPNMSFYYSGFNSLITLYNYLHT